MLSHIFTNGGDKSDKPRVERKWVMADDDKWVVVDCEILRGPGGRYDRPFTSTINAGAKP